MRFHIETQDTYSVVKRVIPEGKTMCSLCSRLRRGVIYRVAKELGATKIALGHHRDDMLETFFLNLFFGGKLKAMPPKLVSDDGNHIVIRPLAYASEADLIRYARAAAVPDHSVRSVRLAGQPAAQADQSHADRVGEALPRAHRNHLPQPAQRRALASGRRAGCSISPASHRPGSPSPGGDIAFDEEPLPQTVVPLRRVDVA